MRKIKRVMFGAVLAVVIFVPVMVAAQGRITTLLPIRSESAPPSSDRLLAITADASDPIKSTSEAHLDFDLSLIPEGANITRATLRLVGRPRSNQNPQIVRIFPESQKEPVGRWFASCSPKCDDNLSFPVSQDSLREAVRTLQPGQMRGRRFEHRGVTVLDDGYNSNPEAARAMLEVLAATAARRRAAVLGEMLELGPFAEELHRKLGHEAARAGLELLVAVRGAARFIAEEAVRAGLPSARVFFFEDPEAAGAFLRDRLEEGDAVLFKGSRGVRIERALKRFMG